MNKVLSKIVTLYTGIVNWIIVTSCVEKSMSMDVFSTTDFGTTCKIKWHYKRAIIIYSVYLPLMYENVSLLDIPSPTSLTPVITYV